VPWAIRFWGTRGSIPAPGPGTVRYGGNTACLELVAPDGRRLVLDAGTGIRSLGLALPPSARDPVVILLSHTHWDHIQGLPFFAPLYRPEATVSIIGPAPATGRLGDVLRDQMGAAVFPVSLSAWTATLDVREVAEGAFEAGGFSVKALHLCHPGTTLGYRIGIQPGSPELAYLTDNEIAGWDAPDRRARLVRFLHACDTMIHDAMYLSNRGAGRRGWGHSTAAEAVRLASEARVNRLVLFHHDPEHTDDDLERLLTEAEQVRADSGGRFDIQIAAEGVALGPAGG